MTSRIRNAVFETNSSSSHSVTVAPDELVDHVLPRDVLRGGVIRAQLAGHYGWEWHRYYEPGSKIAYLATQLAGHMVRGSSGKDVTSVMRRDPRVERMLSVVQRATGCRVEIIGSADPSVDHDSVGVGVELLNDDDELLRFLFSPRSFIETGNDNGGPPSEIMTDIGGAEKYLAPRMVEGPAEGQRFDFTLDGWSFFIHPEGGDPVYADIDDGADMKRLRQALGGIVIEKVGVWMQKPAGLDPEMARELAEDAVHGRLADLADDLPGLRVSAALMVEPAYEETSRTMSRWDYGESASYTFTAVADPTLVERMLDVAQRHAGIAVPGAMEG